MTDSSLPVLDGPRLGPKSGGKPDCLIVFVHGYGADGQDLIGLAPHWQGVAPNAAFVSPNAPERCDMQPFGYQWFPITRLDPAATYAGVMRAAPKLDGFIDAELARLGLGPDRLILVGFSQGTMMSLHVGLRRKVQPLAIIGFSGLLTGVDKLAETTVKPPILLIHGDSDQVIPIQALGAAVKALSDAGFNVHSHVSRGTGHGIAPDGLQLGGAFIEAVLNPVKP
jgi:phospholipase/carboxylesterase